METEPDYNRNKIKAEKTLGTRLREKMNTNQGACVGGRGREGECTAYDGLSREDTKYRRHTDPNGGYDQN